MGQAKLRGSRQDRVAQALEINAELWDKTKALQARESLLPGSTRPSSKSPSMLAAVIALSMQSLSAPASAPDYPKRVVDPRPAKKTSKGDIQNE